MPPGVYERRNAVRAAEQYGDWTTLSRAPGTGPIRWACRCACGTERDVLSRSLKSGGSTGCGCSQRRTQRAAVTTHGQSRSQVYKVWTSMHQRCANPRSQMWARYGARGISVDPRWDDFETFARDMGPRPQGCSIERRDNDGNYCPENCYWATSIEQARNTSRSRVLTFEGTTRTITEWASVTGIHKATIATRVRQGKTAREALALPPKYVKRNR